MLTKRGICIRLFDLHCDTLTCALDSRYSFLANDGAVDSRRGAAFSRWIQAFAVFLPDNLRVEGARERCVALLDAATRFERVSAGRFRIVRSLDDFAREDRVCHALLTGENIGALGDVSYLECLRARHMRAATITWNGDNPWGSGCFGSAHGLTTSGMRALERMEQLGMAVDVSHLNVAGFWDVARLSKRPFMASHSCSAAITPHPRNMTDDQFRAVRDSGGIVGINLYHSHLGISPQGDYFAAFERHLTHLLSLGGENTVCIGTDFDGMERPPSFGGMSVLLRLHQYLLSCGMDAALLDKVFFTNAYRFCLSAMS